MNKAFKMGKDSTKGSFHLFIAKIISTIILAISTIFVGRFISDADYGLFVVALIPVSTFLLFQDWGVSTALTKYCAHYRTTGEDLNLRKIIVSGLFFAISTGVFLTILLFLLANFLATTLGQPDASFLIILGSISILFTGFYTTSQSIFVGFERMGLTGVTMFCQAAVYTILSPILVFLGYGGLGLMISFALSYIIAGVISLLILYFFVFKKLKSVQLNKFEILKNLKTLLRFGIPVAIALLVSGIATQFYSFMMAYYVNVALIGQYKIATNFAVFITFFTVPISTVLFPTFSKIDSKSEGNLLKTVYSSSIKYTALFSLPATIAMIVLSEPIINTLYGDKWIYSPFFLSLEIIQFLFIAIGAITNSTLLQGLGETKLVMKLRILSLLVGIPLAFILIPFFGIVGLIITILVGAWPSIFAGIYWIWRHYQMKADYLSSAKIFISSLIAGAITFIFITIFTASTWILLTFGALLFLVTYIIVVPIIGAINQTDINNLRFLFSSLGFISKLIDLPLKIIEKILRIKQTSSEEKLN